jgi:hypothetical protein
MSLLSLCSRFVVAADLVILAGLCEPACARAQGTFTLGSTAAEVRRAQGVPNVIERLRSLGLEIWTFGASTVRFSSDSLRVVGWDDSGRTLRATMQPGPNVTTSAMFGAGSYADDVVRVMGTPHSVREDHARGTMLWRYGASSVSIGLADRRVLSWTNNGNLRVAVPEAQTAVAMSAGRAAATAPKPNAPANLDASVSFREPSGNGALDGGETGSIIVDLRNRGPGSANDVRVTGRPDSASGTITLGAVAPVPRLDAHSAARVELPVSAALSSPDGRVSVTIGATEANGFGLDVPLRLTIPVREARPPRLELAGVHVDDQSGDGRVSARELADVTVRVWNAGSGTARDAHATIATGDDTFLVEDRARQLTLGTMAPGEHRDLSFSFYTNTRARDVRVIISLTESTGRFGATLTVPFSIDRPVAQTLDVVAPTPSATDSVPVAPPSLLDDVERDIPRAAAQNPDAIAVIIGIERYASLPSARFAARDARLFRQYAATLGVPDDRNHLYVRTDAEATGNEFRKLFADDGWVARRVKPTTDLYVYFSGHGAPEIKTRTPFLLPTDADAAYPRETGYSLGTLYQQVARLNVRTVTVFLDACFTGGTRSNGTLFGGARPIVISVEQPALLRDNFAVISAAGGDQIASDLPEKRHGLFTYFALLGLRGAADADGDSSVTVGELEKYLDQKVPAAAAALDREQKPVVIARNKDRELVRYGARQ